jgi:hypothetical protein
LEVLPIGHSSDSKKTTEVLLLKKGISKYQVFTQVEIWLSN